MRKYKLTRNLGLKIIAVFFAVFLWLIVVNVDDPVVTNTFSDIPVTFVNDDIISQDGNVYQVLDEENVSAVISARRSVLQDIEPDDIVATADIKAMDTDTGLVPVEISLPSLREETDYQSAEAVPRNLQIKIEKTGRKVLALTVSTTGTQRDGYLLGDMTVSPENVTITGPESVIEQIDRAVARIDISGISRDTDEPGELVLYDQNGNQLGTSQLSNNLGEDGITVHVEVMELKSVPVRFETSGMPESGYKYTGCSSEPESIQIYGTSEALSDVEEIVIPGSEIDLEGVTETFEKTIDITPYLPEDVNLVEESSGNIRVTVMIEQEDTRTINLLVSSIKISNLSSDLQVSYQPDAEVSLQFSGEQELLDVLDISNAVSVNLESYTKAGTYNVPVIVDVPEGITLLDDVTVELTLSEKQADTSEQSSDQGDQGQEQEEQNGQ